jgi:peptidoglycan/LPS O-acetylase OafA/YrhL
MFIQGYAHRQAALAETVIAGVLLLGWGVAWIWPARTRRIGVAAQTFALLGTLVGLFTIAIGVGPRTAPDLIYHAAIVVVLIGGLVVGTRASQSSNPQSTH